MSYEVISAEDWLDEAQGLRRDGWWLADLTALDRLHLTSEEGSHRFEVVVQLLHHNRKERKCVHVPAAGEPPTAPSVIKIWPSARNPEREVFDLMGIVFEGHESLTRIMLPDEWEGHPLRKDYAVGKVTIDFVPQPFLQIDAPGQATSTVEAETEVDRLGQSGGPARPPEEPS